MLPKQSRLVKEKDFKQLALKGRPFYSHNLTLKTFKIKEDIFLVGVVVSTKISKKAVERNRIRRQISEIIRLNINNLRTGFKIMILVKKNLLDKNYKEIESELIELFKKASLLKK